MVEKLQDRVRIVLARLEQRIEPEDDDIADAETERFLVSLITRRKFDAH